MEKKIVFSGDIGNLNQPLIKDPEYLDSADYVVMESTYGDRSHGERPDYARELVKILKRTFDKNGNVVVPSFAVGRTQEMLYFLRRIKEENMLPEYPYFDVYVDSRWLSRPLIFLRSIIRTVTMRRLWSLLRKASIQLLFRD